MKAVGMTHELKGAMWSLLTVAVVGFLVYR